MTLSSKTSIQASSSPITTQPHKQSSNTCCHLLVALNVIILIGTSVAAGLLYSQLGPISLAIPGGGILWIILSSLITYGCSDSGQKNHLKTPIENKANQAYRAVVFQQTLKAIDQGYICAGKTIKIDNPQANQAESYGDVPEIVKTKIFQTQFSVEVDDTLNVLLRLKERGCNPVGVNMANRYKAGGGVKLGCPAQEEALCRRTDYYKILKNQSYPFSEFGGIYAPSVVVFRNDETQDFSFMKEPKTVALVAVAAYDLREGQDKIDLNLNAITQEDLLKNQKYIEGTKNKIRNLLRIMHHKNHRCIVLGALGCGAFQNPPNLMSTFFKEIFEKEFQGAFEEVHFAIMNKSPGDQANIDCFKTLCRELSLIL